MYSASVDEYAIVFCACTDGQGFCNPLGVRGRGGCGYGCGLQSSNPPTRDYTHGDPWATYSAVTCMLSYSTKFSRTLSKNITRLHTLIHTKPREACSLNSTWTYIGLHYTWPYGTTKQIWHWQFEYKGLSGPVTLNIRMDNKWPRRPTEKVLAMQVIQSVTHTKVGHQTCTFACKGESSRCQPMTAKPGQPTLQN